MFKSLSVFVFTFVFLLVGTSDMQAQHETEDEETTQEREIVFQSIFAGECEGAYIKVPGKVVLNETTKELSVESVLVEDMRWLIFDRKGKKVFEAEVFVLLNDGKGEDAVRIVDIGWKGRNLGEDLPEDYYAYAVSGTCKGGKRFTGSGMFELAREIEELKEPQEKEE